MNQVNVEGDGTQTQTQQAYLSTDITTPHPYHIGLLHIDCDLYSSTKTVFDHFREYIHPGTVIVFDELLNFIDYEKHEIKALYEEVSDKH